MPAPHWIDSHAHLSSGEIYPKAAALIESAKLLGCRGIVNICTDQESLENGFLLQKDFSQIVNTAAVTPHDVGGPCEKYFAAIEKAAFEGKLVAIGESGLDYYYEHSPRQLQKEWLIKHFKLAIEADLPVVIHCREAFADFFELLDSEYLKFDPKKKGVLHCFTGTSVEARAVVERGWLVSFSGIVTFKKSVDLQEAASVVPLENLLIETDTPYLAPQSKRGKPNEPAFIVETAEMLSKIKNCTLNEIYEKTAANASSLFNL